MATTNEETQKRLEALEARIDDLETENEQLRDALESDRQAVDTSRRETLGLLGGLSAGGLLGAASQPVTASSGPTQSASASSQ